MSKDQDVMHSDQLDRLKDLAQAIDVAIAFAKRWEASYQPHIFRLAVERLVSTDESRPELPKREPMQSVGDPTLTASAIERLSRALNVDSQHTERVILIDGKDLQLLGRVDGKTNREIQRSLSLVLCFIKEIGFSERTVSIEEIRRACAEHGCYDAANFATYLKKDCQDGLLREISDKSGGGKRFLATKTGLDRGAVLFRAMLQ